MSNETISSVLQKYLPSGTVDLCVSWIIEKNIHLKITRSRATKYGDYRPLEKDLGHRISINHNLNPYSFLVTFVHEVAHLECYVKHGPYHEPHGKNWKMMFQHLMSNFLNRNLFPANVEAALQSYLLNPAASSCSDPNLHRALKSHDTGKSKEVYHLEDLPLDTLFKLESSRSGQIFRKGPKIRTRFHCLEIRSKRIYFVNAIAEVEIVQR